MFAAVVRTEVQPGNMDEFIRIYQDQVVPLARTVIGFQDMRVFVDRQTNTVTVVVTYDTEANARAAAESEQARQFGAALNRLSGPISRELCEVFVQA